MYEMYLDKGYFYSHYSNNEAYLFLAKNTKRSFGLKIKMRIKKNDAILKMASESFPLTKRIERTRDRVQKPQIANFVQF